MGDFLEASYVERYGVESSDIDSSWVTQVEAELRKWFPNLASATTKTIYLDGTDSEILRLGEGYINSISTISVFGDEWTDVDEKIDIYADEGYIKIKEEWVLDLVEQDTFPSGTQNIEITGSFGLSTATDLHIELGTLMLIQKLLLSDPTKVPGAIKSERIGNYSYTLNVGVSGQGGNTTIEDRVNYLKRLLGASDFRFEAV